MEKLIVFASKFDQSFQAILKFLALSLILLLAGCQSISSRLSALPRQSCYVHWNNPEDRQKYYDNLNSSRHEKSLNNALIPMFNNTAFKIVEIHESNYELINFATREDYESFRSVIKKYIVLDEDNELDLIKLYQFSNKLLPKIRVEQMVRSGEYELINCQQYQDAVYL